MAEASVATVQAVQACRCEEITLDAIQCPEHYRLWKGGRRLVSVGSIIRASFPMDPSIPPDKLENARERGEQVDRLFAAYVMGKLTKIPAGTRCDASDLFLKLRMWFDRQNFSKVEAQVVLGDDDHGGVLDLRLNGTPMELKATYNIESTHRLQLAGYCTLLRDGMVVPRGHILHVTERYEEPRMVPLERQDYEDWDALLACHRMVKRRSK